MANVDTATYSTPQAVVPLTADDGMDRSSDSSVPSEAPVTPVTAEPVEATPIPEGQTLSGVPAHEDPTANTTAITTTPADSAVAPVHPMPMDTSFTWGGYFQAVGTLLLLLALLWGLVWCVRKYGKFNFLPRPGSFPRDGLRIESQLPIGPRKSLMVVRFLNDRLLLGVTDTQITLLKETRSHTDEDNALDFKELMDKEQRQETDT